MLFNEPKLLKFGTARNGRDSSDQCFSALQRAEIAEISSLRDTKLQRAWLSALQRAEIAEIFYGCALWYSYH